MISEEYAYQQARKTVKQCVTLMNRVRNALNALWTCIAYTLLFYRIMQSEIILPIWNTLDVDGSA
jgi:hypothetical protein